MDKIIKNIDKWFLPRKEHFDIFAENDTRVESWFKAELLVLFSRLKRETVIHGFEREPSLYDEKGKRSQIDFSLTDEGVKHYVELKALCISQSKGTPRNLSFYFRNDNVGIMKDFKKLNKAKVKNKWAVAFIYPKPDKEDWKKVTNELDNWRCITKLEDYPNHLFIALFKG